MALDPRLILGLDTQAPVRTSAALGQMNDRLPALKLAMGLQELQNQQAYRQAQLEEQKQQTAIRNQQLTATTAENQRKEAERKAGALFPFISMMAQNPTEEGLGIITQRMAQHPDIGPEGAARFAQTYRQYPVEQWATLSRMEAAGTPEGSKQASQLMFAPPKEAKPPTIEPFESGNTIQRRQWNPETKSWDVISTAPRWKADEAPAPGAPAGQGKPPSGYRWKADGTMEPVPGGPADMKVQGQFNADTAAFQNSSAALDRLAVAANELMTHKGLGGITGIKGAFPNVPGWSAADAQAKLDVLKSQIGFSVLQTMRDASKTGGALGQVTEKELTFLQNNLEAVSKAQSLEQMKDSLAGIIKFVDESKGRLSSAYNLKHGERTGTPAPAAGQGSSIDVEGKTYEVLSRNPDGTVRIRDPKTGKTGTVRP